MHFKIATRPGTGLDGFPTQVFVLVDHKDEESSFGWWLTWAEAKTKLDEIQPPSE